MEKDPTIINIIKSTAVKHIDDAEVMLFGSRASGKADEGSDYDILIITSQSLSSEDKISLRTKIRKEMVNRGTAAPRARLGTGRSLKKLL